MNKEVSIVGMIPIEALPTTRYERGENRATFCREVLNSLQPGKANLYEFVNKKTAEDYRSMLYSMAILKFGEAGRVKTKIVEHLMYVWLVEQGEV